MEPEEDDDYGEGDGPDNNEERLAELERRVEELESRPTSDDRGEAGVSLGYVVGVSFAMILSWSRNASILWCLLHGFFSWFYVIYFALTR